MTKQDLITRWDKKDYQSTLLDVINCFEKGIPLSTISSLSKFDNRWDLRGATLSVLENENKLSSGGHKLTQYAGSLEIKGFKIDSVDFSYGDISYANLSKCEVTNCVFEETTALRVQIKATSFVKCYFKKANFCYSFMNQNIGENSGAFVDTVFLETNFKECLYNFPIIKGCLFHDCNLMATNFDGSRFEDCQFIGKVDSCWFKGYSLAAQRSLLGIFNRVNPKKFPNLMLNVDFSKAILIGVSFSNSIDLSKCIFPESEDYILIGNLNEVMETSRKIIVNEWSGDDKRKGLALIDSIYFTENKKFQEKDFIDTWPVPTSDIRFDNRFFGLLRSINMNSFKNKNYS